VCKVIGSQPFHILAGRAGRSKIIQLTVLMNLRRQCQQGVTDPQHLPCIHTLIC
jgi:hypothetical protein